MHRTRIKLCGMTQPDQVREAVELGVDAIGMILHADSPREISFQQAKKIRRAVPAFVSLVGVFVDADESILSTAINEIGLDVVQLHGDEPPALVDALDIRVVKALRARSEESVQAGIKSFNQADAILLDPYHKSMHGGTGLRLDHSLWPSKRIQDGAPPMILAGGLSTANVQESILALHPYAVDVNSGVESLPGVKDMTQVAALCYAVGRADQAKHKQ